MSVNLVIIDRDSGLSPARHQINIFTDATSWKHISEILMKNRKVFIEENTSETVVCNIADFLFPSQCINFNHRTEAVNANPDCNKTFKFISNGWAYSIGCQPNEPPATLVTTNRNINIYGFLVVIMLLMYSALHCLYSVGDRITTTIMWRGSLVRSQPRNNSHYFSFAPHEPMRVTPKSVFRNGHPFCYELWKNKTNDYKNEWLMNLSIFLNVMDYKQHDSVINWKHFPRNWPFVRGIHRSQWIPHTKASKAELRCFRWSASE